MLAIGFGAFKHVPDDFASLLPTGPVWTHCDEVALDAYAGKRCVIIGGRQSAYEWAALLREAGSTEVHIVHRRRHRRSRWPTGRGVATRGGNDR